MTKTLTLASLSAGAALVSVLFGCSANDIHAGGSAPERADLEPHVIAELGGVGLCQSPINISSVAALAGHHEISFDYMPSEQRIVNKGHTVELEWDTGSTVSFDGKLYDFRQFHFHTPAEHQIDRKTHPLEMHLVHTLRGDEQTYLVGSILFEEGEENEFLAGFLSAVPDEPQGEVIRHEPIDVRDLIVGRLDYYSYRGSLTTPPYTESVRWVVDKHVRQASKAQLNRLRALEGNNARHVQPLHGRSVERE